MARAAVGSAATLFRPSLTHPPPCGVSSNAGHETRFCSSYVVHLLLTHISTDWNKLASEPAGFIVGGFTHFIVDKHS
ncbi:hypothetical protein JOB18_020805 [Solea senegalensis]|uniref:Uncharacterized protein n=1 Tax=Solea senegalensis TaxID=28829 RepID=A0AAV6PY60_SOLSE|nr:hypothetical protein JOB18_020805 [Solea senegalensis]